MKYTKVKKIQRDMWTETPVGAILETVYFRYLYFLESGKVLYALTTTRPHEMIPRLVQMRVHGAKDKAAVEGEYEIQATKLIVRAVQEWQTVKLELSIQPMSAWGRFGALSFDRHLSSAAGDFDEYWSRDLVEYEVPEQDFGFLKDHRL